MTYYRDRHIQVPEVDPKVVNEFCCWFWLRSWMIFPHLPGELGCSDLAALPAITEAS